MVKGSATDFIKYKKEQLKDELKKDKRIAMRHINGKKMFYLQKEACSFMIQHNLGKTTK